MTLTVQSWWPHWKTCLWAMNSLSEPAAGELCFVNGGLRMWGWGAGAPCLSPEPSPGALTSFWEMKRGPAPGSARDSSEYGLLSGSPLVSCPTLAPAQHELPPSLHAALSCCGLYHVLCLPHPHPLPFPLGFLPSLKPDCGFLEGRNWSQTFV